MHYIIIIFISDSEGMLDVLENTLTGIYALYKYIIHYTLFIIYYHALL